MYELYFCPRSDNLEQFKVISNMVTIFCLIQEFCDTYDFEIYQISSNKKGDK